MKCQHLKDNGDPCAAPAMADGFCFFHSPNIPEDQKSAARVTGGKNNALVIREALPPIPIHKPEDAVSLISDTITRIRSGTMDPRVGNSIASLVNSALKAIEVANIERRLSVIEGAVSGKRVKTA
jgi:hypothetical protein